MGNFQSNTTKNMISAYTSILNNISLSVVNESRLGCNSSNFLNLQTGGATPEQSNCVFKLTNGDLIISQRAESKCQLVSENINDISSEIKNEVRTQTESFINADLKNSQGFFATAFSFQEVNLSNATEVADVISNSFAGNITNICTAQVNAFNHQILLLCGEYNNSNIIVNQDALTTSITSCINENIVKLYNNNVALKDLILKTDSKLYSEQKGINIGQILLIIGIIVVVIIIIALIIYFATKGGGKNPSKPPTK